MLRPLALMAALLAAFPAAAEDISLAMGQVSVLTPGGQIGTVVVGDPRVADAVVDGDTHIMIFGKGVGETDLVVFNIQREMIFSGRIGVSAAAMGDDVVVVNGGGSQTLWSCAPGEICKKGGKK